ncbi:hypothetical protein [Okeania sp. SIO2C2]|uniref:hypothetical protein n=1 Tax=Okeania sp. SIO2C2 TaxID=2607787 RepID=UPI00257D81B6|nr:hypothetical protein [Okeania sp. SIO2C2]
MQTSAIKALHDELSLRLGFGHSLEEWFEEWETGYPSFTLAGINDTGQQTTSQLSTRQYYKKRTRSGSMPFGRQSIATPDAGTGTATTAIGDRIIKIV